MAVLLAVPFATKDDFVATAGQVTFILSEAPSNSDSVVFLVNGADYNEGSDWVRSGVTITWLNIFPLEAGDHVSVRYEV